MKKAIKVAALGISFMAAVATASANDLSLNIYGASAQYTFWDAFAAGFVDSLCTGPVTALNSADGKKGLKQGNTCTFNGTSYTTITIRYTSANSLEGLRSAANMDPKDYDGCVTGNLFNDPQRSQGTISGGTLVDACLPVNVGASDVALTSFDQITVGLKDKTGLSGVTNKIDLKTDSQYGRIPTNAQLGTPLQPIAVPFSFFVNKQVTLDDSINGKVGVKNLSRQQILLLESGSVTYWSQFSPIYPDHHVALCLRNAGSGTHATLNKAILRSDKDLVQYANHPSITLSDPLAPAFSASKPYIVFVDGSSDMMNCINNNASLTADGDGYPVSALGYADSDLLVYGVDATDGHEIPWGEAPPKQDGTAQAKWGNVTRVLYNGMGAGLSADSYANFAYADVKNEIMNGQYEFFSKQWLYPNKNNSSAQNDLFTAMNNYVATVSMNCTKGAVGTSPNKLGCFWMTSNDLQYLNKTYDTSIPTL